MKIGDKVVYTDEYLGGDKSPNGEVAEPTKQELETIAASDGAIGPDYGDVVVEWSDGSRYWESPDDLVVIQEAGA